MTSSLKHQPVHEYNFIHLNSASLFVDWQGHMCASSAMSLRSFCIFASFDNRKLMSYGTRSSFLLVGKK